MSGSSGRARCAVARSPSPGPRAARFLGFLFLSFEGKIYWKMAAKMRGGDFDGVEREGDVAGVAMAFVAASRDMTDTTAPLPRRYRAACT